MSIETDGIERFRLKLLRLAETPEVANQELRRCADDVAALARQMAPLDEGNLEKAIKVRYEGTQGAGGRFVKGGGAYAVFIDDKMEIDGRDGKTVGDYAWIMHEHLTPAGPMNLGPKSQEKQQRNPNVEVGGKFLERALEMMRERVNVRLTAAVMRHVESLDNE